jgi:peptidyl-prolyl cis-trans isomerase D
MLKTLRNPKHIKMVMWCIIVPIIVSFCLFYGWNSMTGAKEQSGQNQSYVAKVNGVEISRQEYQDEYKRMIDQLKQMYGSTFNEQEAAQLGLASQVVDELEDKALVLQEAPKMGISVSDAELSSIIVNSKGFQDENGRFSPQIYARYLNDNQMTPEMFESQLRLDRMYSKAQNAVTDFIKVTEPEVREEFRKEFEKMSVDVLRFSAVDYIQNVNVDDKEAETYYKAHTGDYTIPPLYNLAYLTVSPKLFEKNIQITFSDISSFYEDNPEQFATQPRVHVEHILIKVPEKGTQKEKEDFLEGKFKQISDKLVAKVPFEQVAKEFSEDPGSQDKGGDLGWVKPGDTVPEFEKVAFSTATGQISQPFQTKYGFHILKVLDREESRIQKLDEVKNAIVETLKTQDADSTAEAQIEKFLKEMTPQTKILDLAENGYTKGTTGWFSGDKIPGFEDNKDLATDLLSLSVGKAVGPVKSKEGYNLLQLIGKQDSRIPKFEEVRTQVKTQLLFQKAQEEARKKSQEADQMVKSGASLEEIAAKMGRKITSLPPFSLGDNIPGIGKETPLAMAAFNLPDGKTSNAFPINDPIQRGLTEYFIIKVKERVGASEANYLDEKQQIEQKVLLQKKRQIFNDWVSVLRNGRRLISISQCCPVNKRAVLNDFFQMIFLIQPPPKTVSLS